MSIKQLQLYYDQNIGSLYLIRLYYIWIKFQFRHFSRKVIKCVILIDEKIKFVLYFWRVNQVTFFAGETPTKSYKSRFVYFFISRFIVSSEYFTANVINLLFYSSNAILSLTLKPWHHDITYKIYSYTRGTTKALNHIISIKLSL